MLTPLCFVPFVGFWKMLRYGGALLVAIMACAVHAEVATVAVASNFAAPMKELVAEFERDSGHKIRLAFGSSGKFHAQIKHGAPFDAFFSADQAVPMALEQDGLVVSGSRFTYGVGTLALWSAKAGFVDEQGEILRQLTFNKIAIANPRVAPYGVAAMEVLQALGVEQRIKEKLVQGENVAQTYQFVATGNADLGFVATSQIVDSRAEKSGSVWRVPQHLYSPIRQDAVLLYHGEQNPAAHQLLHFMKSDSARAIMSTFGYQSDIGQG